MIKNESKINKTLKEYDIWQTRISIRVLNSYSIKEN